jgi:hypothetical protein
MYDDYVCNCQPHLQLHWSGPKAPSLAVVVKAGHIAQPVDQLPVDASPIELLPIDEFKD